MFELIEGVHSFSTYSKYVRTYVCVSGGKKC